MIGFNKLRDDFKAMNMSFYFLIEKSSVISQLLSSIWGFVTLIFQKSYKPRFFDKS
jgi:hypothetical protein